MFWVRLNVLGWPGYAALRSFSFLFFFYPKWQKHIILSKPFTEEIL